MHCVLLGVVKRLISIWIKGKPPNLLPNRDILSISEKLIICSKTEPKEFQRKIRGLLDFGYFKATELRTFLLYAGPVVLKNILTNDMYNHFLLLHVAISILCNKNICKEKSHVAKSMIKEFVEETAEIYGLTHLTFNMHTLTHIPDDVDLLGDLDNYSAFEFESEMYVIKQLLRKNNQELAQISNRISERSNQFALKKNSNRNNYPFYNTKFARIKRFETEKYRIDDSEKNRWILTNSNNILKFHYMKKINNKYTIFATEIESKQNFYNFPMDSSKLNIYEADVSESELKRWDYTELKSKLFCMQSENKYVFLPLLHTS